MADKTGMPLSGVPVELRANGYGSLLTQPLKTDATGQTAGTIASTAPENKTVRAFVFPGTTREQELGSVHATFVEILPNVRYVRQSGLDSNDGRTPITAWQTIAFAMTQIVPGDTLYIGAGTYGPIEIRIAASPSTPLILAGDPQGLFTGDAGEVVIDGAAGDHGVLFDGASSVQVRNLSVRNALPVGAQRGGGIWFSSALNENCSILECSLFENSRGIDVQVAKNLVIESSRTSNNTGPGISLGTTVNTHLVQSLVYGNDAEGLLMEGQELNLFVGLTTFYGNGGDQILEMSSAGSTGRIADNIVAGGSANALSFQPFTQFTVENNMSWANVGSEIGLGAPGPLNIVADPLFVDPAGPDGVLGGVGSADDDFRVQSGSPALDAGDLPANQSGLDFGGSMVNYTSRSDGKREGIAPDGATVNLGYHYPGDLDSYASSDPAGGRVSFVRPGEAVLSSSARSASGSYGSPLRAQDVGSEVRWVVQALTPGRPDEWNAVLSEDGNSTRIDVRRWNGRVWAEGKGPRLASAILPQNTGERGFDLAVESLSGDGLLVRSNNDANPLYRTLRGGTWSDDAPVFTPSLGTGVVLWVELVSDPGSDRIAMVALDDQQRLTASIWEGSTWSNPVLLGTEIVSMREFKPFDAAWESQSGDLLVMWGFSVFAEQARYATLAPGGTWLFGTHPSTEAVGSTIKLAADPTTDRIVAVLGEGSSDDDVAVAIWDGAAWADTAEVTLAGVPGQHSLAAGWIGNTGRAFAVWREPSQPGTFMSARFDDFWKIEGARTIAGVGSALAVDLRAIPGTNEAEAVLLDDTGRLFSARVGWDGNASTWQVGNGGTAIDSGLDGTLPTRTFAFDLRQP